MKWHNIVYDSGTEKQPRKGIFRVLDLLIGVREIQVRPAKYIVVLENEKTFVSSNGIKWVEDI